MDRLLELWGLKMLPKCDQKSMRNSATNMSEEARVPDRIPGWCQEGAPPLSVDEPPPFDSSTPFSSPFACLPFLSFSFASLGDFWRPRRPKGPKDVPKSTQRAALLFFSFFRFSAKG